MFLGELIPATCITHSGLDSDLGIFELTKGSQYDDIIRIHQVAAVQIIIITDLKRESGRAYITVPDSIDVIIQILSTGLGLKELAKKV